MNADLATILLGFLEGFALILSPCILAILPIILAGSLAGSKQRSLGIIIGFVITFALFALFARQLVHYSGIDSNVIRYIAYGFLFLFALILLSNYLTELFNRLTQRIATLGGSFSSPAHTNRGFWGGLVLGGLVSIIWTPCAGPILAAILVQVAIQKTNTLSFFTLLAFALGAAIPMFIIALYGFKIKNTFQFFKTHTVLIRKILGAVILLNLGYMISQETGFTSSTVINQTPIRTANYLENGVWIPYQAPPIGGIQEWINSPPLQLSELMGKVVLIDFWTYSCINCIRTLPYLNDWYKKYHDKGLVIIGVHTPEFEFEKNAANVRNAVRRDGIQYPVALDNAYVTWENYSNHFWPAHYLINKQGKVVYERFGEGDYDVTENNIRFLLGLDTVKSAAIAEPAASSSQLTPETYLGYGRATANFSPDLVHNSTASYSFPQQLMVNSWGLQGSWLANADKIISAQNNASLKINFHARKVFIVMGNNTKTPIKVRLLLNGKPLNHNRGSDVLDSSILVDKYSLYEAVVLPKSSQGVLQLTADNPGLELFTFTFGE